MEIAFEGYNTKQVVPEETLRVLSSLIVDTENAVRRNSSEGEYRTVYEESKMLQRLLYSYFKVNEEMRSSGRR